MTAAVQPAISVHRPEPRPWLLAALWLVGLAPFFFLSYGFATSITSQRSDVGTIVFGWERHIPFLAWTIVPYWSIDLLYGLSLALCRTRQELMAHCKRLVTAQVISVAGFLLFPLRFTFERPPTSGIFGDMFDILMGFDKPFNQAPSLHLSLAVILWARYQAHLRGWARALAAVWFILIGFSTLTTYQHHFVDLPTGMWAGLIAIALFPMDSAAQRSGVSRDPKRFRLAAFYGLAALLLGTLCFTLRGPFWLLLWPAGSLAVVSAVYVSGCPDLLRRRGESMRPGVLLLIAPYVAGAWLNSRWWTRHDEGAQEIAGGVWLGRMPSRLERQALGIASLVDVTAEFKVNYSGVAYRSVPMLDLLVPTIEQLDAAVAAIDDLRRDRPTLVSCALGYSRSAMTVAAWLIASGNAASVDEAIARIRGRRPRIVLSEGHRQRLLDWAQARQPA